MPQTHHSLDFEIRGPRFAQMWPLRDIVFLFGEFQDVVEEAFHFSYRMPKRDVRGALVINAQSFERSSFHAKLELIMSVVQLTTFATLAQVTTKDAWGVVRDGYAFLKALYTSRNSGVEPSVTVDQRTEHGVNVYGNNIVVNNTVLNFAESSEKNFKRIAKRVDESNISLISAFDSDDNGFQFTPIEAALFNPRTIVARNPVAALVRVFQFNVDTLTGRLEVIESDQVPLRAYNFTLQRPANKDPFVYALLGEPIRIAAQKEIEIRASGVEHISRLIILRNDEVGQTFFPV